MAKTASLLPLFIRNLSLFSVHGLFGGVCRGRFLSLRGLAAFFSAYFAENILACAENNAHNLRI